MRLPRGLVNRPNKAMSILAPNFERRDVKLVRTKVETVRDWRLSLFLIVAIATLIFLMTSSFAHAATIWEDNFEGAGDMTGGWTRSDDNPASGSVYWGEPSWSSANHTVGGSKGAWCAAVGGDLVNHRYANSMAAHAERTLDLSAYSSATVTFWYKIPSQYLLDTGGFSINGDDWFLMGPTQYGWTQFSLDVTSYCGGSVNLDWWWYSYTGGTQGEGIYIDDIKVVTGTPPDTIIDAGPSGPTNYNDVNFTYHGEDGPGDTLQYSYKLEGHDANWSAWSAATSKAYPDLLEGDYIFKVKARDQSELEDPVPAERSFTVDTVSPAAPISLSANPSNWTGNNLFSVSWNNPSDQTGIAAAWYKLDSPPASGSDGIRVAGNDRKSISDITVSGNGSHAIYVWLEDAAGNKNHANRALTSLKYDSSVPSVDVTSPASGSTVAGTVNVQANASDTPSGIARVEFYVDGGLIGTDTGSPYSYPWDTSGLAPGSAHNVTAKAFDNAGNSQSDANTVFMQQFVDPQASSIWYFAEGYTGSGFQEWLTLQNPNAESANVTIEYSYRGGGGSTQTLAIGPNTRQTVDVNGQVGSNKEVSAKVTSDKAIIAERPMYFNFNGINGGHNVVGYAAP